jgi:hypothetical protein
LAHTVFADDAPVPAATSAFVTPFAGRFQPAEPLRTYAGLRAGGEWVLGVYDRSVDGVAGKLESASLAFTARECDPTVHWQQLQPAHADGGLAVPPPRAQHAAVAVGPSLFVFGGRGAGDAAMSTRVNCLPACLLLSFYFRRRTIVQVSVSSSTCLFHHSNP